MDKRELRKYYKSLRNSMTEEERENASRKITEKILSSEYFGNCRALLCFVSVGSEFMTRFIMEAAFREGKTVAVPRIRGKEMVFGVISSPGDLVPGEYDIPTCPEDAGEIKDFAGALCIVPCLSADASLNRLGYGGGFYDRFFASHGEVRKICVCFDKCTGENLPEEETDIPVDLVITETRTFGGVIDAR